MTDIFDFVIVGAGSAGCVVAERLSQSGRHSVLVLEAGASDDRWDIRVPAGYANTFFNDAVNWCDTTLPEPNLNGRSIYVPSGKVLGGSSSINGMVYVRGNVEDYDSWEAAGNPGWGYSDVLRCFRSIESTPIGDDLFRGRSGPVRVSRATGMAAENAFYDGLRELGVPENLDYNGEAQEGFGPYQHTIAGGTRFSAARAFLTPARSRRNVCVRTRARVARLFFSGRRADGVEYEQGGARRIARARLEVIVSAGALRSPQLLQLSGIGPVDLLRACGIQVRSDAPQVGDQLQDHAGCVFAFKSRRPTLNTTLGSVFGKARALRDYLLAREGPLGSSLFTSGAFVRTRPELRQPDLQLYFVPASFTGIGRKPGNRLRLDAPQAFSFIVCPLRPTSRGRIRIADADFRSPPRVQLNYLETDADKAAMIRGVRYVHSLIETRAMRALIEAPLLPFPTTDRDDEILTYLRASSSAQFHPAGACRMGPDPASAVVSPRLKVHGFDGLRVIDASIMPAIVSGNTNAAAMMIGARGAELILEDVQSTPTAHIGGEPSPKTTTSPLLELQGIVKTFPGVVANDSVDLRIEPGEIHALVGENGAGKSTLVKIICGLVRPDAGQIRWREAPVVIANPNHARRLGVGWVMQHFSLVPALTVFENIALVTGAGETRQALGNRIRATVARYRLEVDLEATVATLSMGERQRIEIVRALLSDPCLLIMDEPTSVLSPREIDALFAVLRQLAADGKSVLYISHKLHEIQRLCHNVTVLRAGKCVATGLAQEETAGSLAEKMLGTRPATVSFPQHIRPGAPRLVVSNLSTPPGTGSGVALANVSFTVRAGEILGIAGIAGNGQDCLHAALAGELQQQVNESILLDGRPVGRLPPAKRRAMGLRAVPEERHGHAAVAGLSLTANTVLTAWESPDLVINGFLRAAAIKARTEEIIRRFKVRTPDAEAAARALSGGNLQRYVIGREILQRPRILVVSQPTWGVDLGASVIIHQELVDLAAQGAAVVIISQDIEELLSISTTFAVLSTGTLSGLRPTNSVEMEEIGRLMAGRTERPDTPASEAAA